MKKFKFVIALLFSLLALLIVVPAQTNQLWKLTLLVTEQAHYFSLLVLILLMTSKIKTVLDKIIFTLFVLSFILFTYPAASAFFIGSQLKSDLIKAYGETEDVLISKPFNLAAIYFPQQPKTKKTVIATIIYKKYGSDSLTLDLYRPGILNRKFPLVVSVHGGAWSSGNNKTFESFDNYLSSLGFIVADVNYRFAPQYKFPAAIEDVKEAIKYLRENSAKFSIDTNRTFLLGRSAGGQIALIAAGQLKYPLIKGVIAFYTPSDMVWGYFAPGNPRILDSRKVLSDYLGGSYENAKDNYYESSPLEVVDKDFPPVLFIHGKRDEMVAYEHNLHIMPKLNKYHIPNYLLTLPWGTHGCDFFLNSPGGQLSTYGIDFFLHSQCRKLR